jgi:hypothetical protein
VTPIPILPALVQSMAGARSGHGSDGTGIRGPHRARSIRDPGGARATGRIALAACMLLGLAGGAWGRPFSEPDETRLDRHGHYRSRDGSEVHQPAKTVDGTKPTGASATCRDGTWSFSHTHRGTCSRHGGVLRWDG